MLKRRLAVFPFVFVFALAIAFSLTPGIAFAANDSLTAATAASTTYSEPSSAVLKTQAATYLEGIPKPKASDLSISAEKDSIFIEVVGTDEYGDMSRYYVGAIASTVQETPNTALACPFYHGWEKITGLQPNTTYYVYVCFMSMKITRPTAEYYGDWSEPIVVKTLPDEAAQEADLANAEVIVAKTPIAYTGTALKPAVTVKTKSGKELELNTDFEVTYKDNVKVGTATVIVKGAGEYKGEKSTTFKIVKAKQPMTATAKNLTVKSAKKNQSFKASKAFTVKKAKGTITYKATKNVTKNAMKKVKVAENGKVTVKKGTKQGTYKLKVKITATGTSAYKSGSKTVTLVVIVK